MIVNEVGVLCFDAVTEADCEAAEAVAEADAPFDFDAVGAADGVVEKEVASNWQQPCAV